MIDIFISYKKKDSLIKSQELLRTLRKVGWNVWLDENDLLGAKIWSDELLANLNTAKCVVGLWSKECKIDNPDDWVVKEFRQAFKLKKLIPCITDDSTIPKEFISESNNGVQFIDLKGINRVQYASIGGLRKLLNSIVQFTGLPDEYQSVEDLLAANIHEHFEIFKIGNITIPAKLVIGSVKEPFSSSEINIIDKDEIYENRSDYPTILKNNYDFLLNESLKLYNIEKKELRDNPMVRLDNWLQEPEGENDERGNLKLFLSRTTYLKIWATNTALDVKFIDPISNSESSLRDIYYSKNYDLENSKFANNPGVEVMLISHSLNQTPTTQVILRQRSKGVAGYKGWYQSSAAGHFSPAHKNNSGLPSPFITAIHETEQETSCNLELKEDDYKLIGIGVNHSELHPSFIGFIETNHSVEEIIYGAGGRDRYEGFLTAIPFTPKAVMQHISENKWIPLSALCAILTLQHFFSYSDLKEHSKTFKGIDEFILDLNLVSD